jgi:hypothetical protein
MFKVVPVTSKPSLEARWTSGVGKEIEVLEDPEDAQVRTDGQGDVTKSASRIISALEQQGYGVVNDGGNE